MTTFEICLRLTPGVHPFIEAWDCDGLNQVGAFPHFGGRWSEWNGKFRDVVRNFIKVRREGQSMPVLNVHFPHAQASINIKSSALVSVPILHRIYQGLNHRPPPLIRGLTAPGPHIPSHSLTLPSLIRGLTAPGRGISPRPSAAPPTSTPPTSPTSRTGESGVDDGSRVRPRKSV